MSNEEIQKTFGKRVRELRKAKGLTQEELASAIDFSVDTISNIERGFSATKISTTALIAEKLGVELAELFGAVHAQPFPDEIQACLTRLIEIAGEEKILAQLNLLERMLEK